MEEGSRPLISIVTVCLNAEDVIEKTLKSVIEQNFTPKEYIVVDGASTDKTKSILEKYREYIDILISEKDSGIYNAMNKSVYYASGEWILFLNAGDVLLEGVLNNIAPLLKETKSDVIYGDIYHIKKGTLQLNPAPNNIKNKYRIPYCHQAEFARTELHRKYPFEEKYKLSADYAFFKRVLLSGHTFEKTSLPITHYDMRGLSNQYRIKGLSENASVIKEMDNLVNRLRFLSRLYFKMIKIKCSEFVQKK